VVCVCVVCVCVWGLYQYPFIDVDRLGYPQVFINAGGILAGFVLIALVVVGLDKIIKPRT